MWANPDITGHTAVSTLYRCADKSLARSGRKQARKHIRDARDFSNIETRAVIKSPPPTYPQSKAPKEIHAILTTTMACFLPGRAKDLSAPLYNRNCWPHRNLQPPPPHTHTWSVFLTKYIWTNKSLRCAGYVARMGIGELHIEFWWGNMREKGHM